MIRLLTTAVLLLSIAANASVLNIGTCRFRGENGRIFLELYIEMPRNQITFYQDSSGWIGSVNYVTHIIRDSDTIAVDSWKVDDFAEDPGQINERQNLIDSRIYDLRPGVYSFHVTAVDSVAGKTMKQIENVDLKGFDPVRLGMSDIELATNIIPAGILPKFDRDGFGLVPGIKPILRSPDLFFLYYVEVYPAAAEGMYQLSRYVLMGQDTVKRMPLLTQTDVTQAYSNIDSVFVDSLATGAYDFHVIVSDEQGNSVSNSERFYIYRPDMPYPINKITYDSSSVEAELQEIEFLLNRDQILTTDGMSFPEKVDFLDAFWRMMDDDPSTPEVPLRAQFRDRVAEADGRFGNSRSPGHKTNRGRIFVLYGPPDLRETYPLESHAKPYEIWSYDDIEGGVEFVFVDRSGLGEYNLIHSTKRGEVSNADWYNTFVQRSGMDSGR